MGKIVNHWGILVDPETPVTGVVHNANPEWLIEEVYYGDAINLDFEEHCKECDEEYHDDCWMDNGSETYLVGSWKQDDDGLYEPDQSGEYSAIMGEVYTQVVWSKYTSRCALCSPCYPGQGNLDQQGEFLTYDLPPEVWGDNREKEQE